MESSKLSGHHNQEIADDDVLRMIADKHAPVLRRGPPVAPSLRLGRPIGTHSTWRNIGRLACDFPFQNNLKPLRCRPISVSGLTITKASFQLQRRDQTMRPVKRNDMEIPATSVYAYAYEG
jgi:hypothetical protein